MQDQPEPKEKLQPQNNQKLDVTPYLELFRMIDLFGLRSGALYNCS